jgi:DNA-binding transcriptional ArsR family regulator
VCGEVGVGKTSLANYEKFIWKKKRDHALFSFRREIEASEQLLDKRSFLTEIIASIMREIQLTEPSLLKKEPLAKFSQLVDLTQSLSFSANLSADIAGFGGGVGFGRDTSYKHPVSIPISILEAYFSDLLAYLMQYTIGGIRYRGLVVHINNFDVVLKYPHGKERVVRFLDEVRDLLQTRGVYFLFLGPTNFYQEVIASSPRVKSIFSPVPLYVEPLTKQEVARAFEERMVLLKSHGVREYIKPVHDEVVFRLYDLYGGDIRSIMTALADLLGQYADTLGRQLSLEEALPLLGRERWERIEAFGLKSEQRKVLQFIVSHGVEVSQKEVTTSLGKQASNVSSYYMRPLQDTGIIEEKRREGRTIFYGLTTDYEPLRWYLDGRRRLAAELTERAELQVPLL